jgi:hypothetical protein
MTEEEARLALLQSELSAVQNSITGLDAITFQIKGWCVTTALAIGGFAVVYHKPTLILIALASVAGFFLVNCQFKAIQRSFIKRNLALDSELRTIGVMKVLKGGGKIDIIGTAIPDFSGAFYSRLWREARLPNTWTLYAFIFACLAVETIILTL